MPVISAIDPLPGLLRHTAATAACQRSCPWPRSRRRRREQRQQARLPYLPASPSFFCHALPSCLACESTARLRVSLAGRPAPRLQPAERAERVQCTCGSRRVAAHQYLCARTQGEAMTSGAPAARGTTRRRRSTRTRGAGTASRPSARRAPRRCALSTFV